MTKRQELIDFLTWIHQEELYHCSINTVVNEWIAKHSRKVKNCKDCPHVKRTSFGSYKCDLYKEYHKVRVTQPIPDDCPLKAVALNTV